MLILVHVIEIKPTKRKCMAVDENPLRLHLHSFDIPTKYMQICKMDSQTSPNKTLQVVSYESAQSNITKLIFLLHKAYFYMT